MKNILFFLILLSLGSCTHFGPDPVGKFDITLDKLHPTFERLYLVDAVQLKNKDIIVGGYVELKDNNGLNALLVRLNNWGIVQEILQFDTQADETITSMAMDGDENVYLAGRRQDSNKTRHGIICKASTAHGLQKSWNKIYEWLPSRLIYKIMGNGNKDLTIFRSAISGEENFSGNAGLFLLDTSGTHKRCEKKFNYYDMIGYAHFQDKAIFGGTAYSLPQMPYKPNPSVVTLLNHSNCQMNHRTRFDFTTQEEFNHIGALSVGQEGNIYAIMNKIDTVKTTSTGYFFQAYFVQLQLDTSLMVLNPTKAKVKLAMDTSQTDAICQNMATGRDGTFIIAINYKGHGTEYTEIQKREATYPEKQSWDPLAFKFAHTKKLIALPYNKTLIICGNSREGINRLIRLNTKGQIE